jgi:hypothetical protein
VRGELKGGTAGVDLRAGSVAATAYFKAAVKELFDVKIFPGQRFPEVLGLLKEAVQNAFVAPPRGTGVLSGGRGSSLSTGSAGGGSVGFTQESDVSSR